MNKLDDYIKLAEGVIGDKWIVTDKASVLVPGNMTINIVMNGYTFIETMEQAKFIAASRTIGPAMAKALIEAEEVVGELMDIINGLLQGEISVEAGEIDSFTLQPAETFIATIKKLKENEK